MGKFYHPQHTASVCRSEVLVALQYLMFKCYPSERQTHGEKAILFLKMSSHSCLNHFYPILPLSIPSHMVMQPRVIQPRVLPTLGVVIGPQRKKKEVDIWGHLRCATNPLYCCMHSRSHWCVVPRAQQKT